MSALDPRLKKNPFYRNLFSTFDRGLTIELDRFGRYLGGACEKVKIKLEVCEERVNQYVAGVKAQTEVLTIRELLKSKFCLDIPHIVAKILKFIDLDIYNMYIDYTRID